MQNFRQKFDRELYYLSHKYYQKAVAIHPYTKTHPSFTSYNWAETLESYYNYRFKMTCKVSERNSIGNVIICHTGTWEGCSYTPIIFQPFERTCVTGIKVPDRISVWNFACHVKPAITVRFQSFSPIDLI